MNDIKLIDEQKRIFELMGINSNKIILLEGGGTFGWFTDLPIFSKYASYFGDETSTHFGNVDSWFRRELGITGTDVAPELLSRARTWFQSANPNTSTKSLSETEIIEKYLTNNYGDAMLNANAYMAFQAKESLETELRSLLDFGLLRGETDDAVTNVRNTDDYTLARLDPSNESDIDDLIKKSEAAAKWCRERAAANASDTRLSTAYTDAAIAFDKRAKIYESWKANVKDIGEANVFDVRLRINDIEYDMSGLNFFQRFWWKSWIQGYLPVEFLNVIIRLIAAFRQASFDNLLLYDMARFTSAYRQMNAEDIVNVLDSGNIFRETPQGTINAMANRIYSTILASIGKPKELRITLTDLLRSGNQDVIGAWNNFLGILNNVEGMTQAEKDALKDYILKRYLTSEGKETSGMGAAWDGFVTFGNDINTLIAKAQKERGIKPGDDALDKAKLSLEEYKTGPLRRTFNAAKYFVVGELDGFWAYFSLVLRKILSWSLTAIPAGLKALVEPMMLRGVNIMSILESAFRFLLTKLIFITIQGCFVSLGMIGKHVYNEAVKEEGTRVESVAGPIMNELNKYWKQQAKDIIPIIGSHSWKGAKWGWETYSITGSKEKKEWYYTQFLIFESKLSSLLVSKFNEFVLTDLGDQNKINTDAQNEWVTKSNKWLEGEIEKAYKSSSETDKNILREKVGYNQIFNNIETYAGMDRSKKELLLSRLFIKLQAELDQDKLNQINNNKITTGSQAEKFGIVISSGDYGGKPMVCSKKLDKGMCPKNANYYRLININNNFLEEDEYFKEYIYDKTTKKFGTFIGKGKKFNRLGELAYVTNSNLELSGSISLGKDCKNVDPISMLFSRGLLKETKIITRNKILLEMSNGKKFGEDNFKHWKKTFTFYNFDEENGEYKEVKITSKMDEVMDTIDHYRKKYDEDDSFVRAVIDVFGDKIDRVSFNKGLAHLTENRKVFGLMKVLANIRESKELEIWTVKHYSDGNWELVKGSFNKKELQNVGKTVRDRDKESEDRKKPVEGLKKKEQQAIEVLKRDEDLGLESLPIKVKEKVKEKLSKGWTTEEPFSFLEVFYTKSEINSVFNDKISIYKLEPSDEFFNSLVNNSSRINLRKGFCKTLNDVKNYKNISEKEERILKHFLTKCSQKFRNKLVKKYKSPYNA